MNTRPRIIAARIAPDAPGLRAMPSHAEDATRDCASAPPNAASAIPNAAEMATQFVPPAGIAAVCANAAGLNSNAPASAPTVYITFLIASSLRMNRQAVVARSSPRIWLHFETALQP